MKVHLAGLAATLHEHLPTLLPAHAVLGASVAEFADDDRFADRRRGDYVYVQGRGDRLHAFLAVRDDTPEDVIARFADADANWCWLVAWEEDVTPALVERARSRALGVVSAHRDGRLERREDAPPRAGIFIKAYPALRARWRELSDW